MTRGDWMTTYSGKRFYPMDPTPEEVDPIDIAHSLGLLCRFGGHSRVFYSVAEHCVKMSQVSPDPVTALWALIHDATEAYLGDMISPLKRQMPQYREAETRVMGAVASRFGLVGDTLPHAVKVLDHRILITERNAILNHDGTPWYNEPEPLPVEIECWSPQTAETVYLGRLNDLLKQVALSPSV